MPARGRSWTCKPGCLSVNEPRKRKCQACGKARPKRRKAKHLVALEVEYAEYVALNGGEHCGICGTPGSSSRRLDRDHDHRTGKPRGLLHPRCNRALPNWITPEWLDAAAAYLRRAA